MKRLALVYFFLFIVISFAVADYPVITRLDSNDVMYLQLCKSVESMRGLVQNKNQSIVPEHIAKILTIYAYTPTRDEELLNVSARCNVPYWTIATLNHIEHQGTLKAGKTILIPSSPGLFVPATPGSDLEQLMLGTRTEGEGVQITVSRNNKKELFFFLPGAVFTGTEMAFFVTQKNGFQYPLKSYTLTSSFGMRANPVTGAVKNHNGLDLAAPMNTAVYASQSGVVTEVGNDSIYGNYIIIKHDNGWASLYGHLSKIETSLQSSVQASTIIGRVGSTGQSTGPHLHFELRQNGRAQDPGKYLFR